MRRPYLVILGACLLHAIAWFLPVFKGAVTFPDRLPGWEAFRVAASGVWPDDTVKFDHWYNPVVYTMSAVTTLVFLPASAWLVSRGSLMPRRVSAWVATSAFIANAHWYVLVGSDRKDLKIGYFLWWLSFLLVALGLFDLSRRRAEN